ncbi:MAG TPA: cobalt-precorrin-6A reductase [Hyphomicrobium sp.]|nr:cobalt-precorrin-6A reductase [Hyphomicrobium sp.]
MRILVLGGTTEASALVRRLAGDTRFSVTLSLAGRTAAPQRHPVETRIGGFGGAAGLARWARDSGIDAIVDATHPFAARISSNAVEAARLCDIPIASVVRAPWHARDGDRWICVDGFDNAASAIGAKPQRVLLTIGRQEVGAFCAAPHHIYIVRTIDPPDEADLPPHVEVIRQRGPFGLQDEIAVMRAHGIGCIVSKNAGGDATYAKIAAARELELPVIMISRPHKPARLTLEDVDAACAWLELQREAHCGPRSDRGV